MSDEAARHSLRSALTRALGADEAATLMEHLPPVPWDRLATKEDLTQLEERFELRFEMFEHKLVGEFRRLIIDQNRLLFFSMVGAMFPAASVAFAAAEF